MRESNAPPAIRRYCGIPGSTWPRSASPTSTTTSSPSLSTRSLRLTQTETVIREGRVIAERPKIVTPYYLTHLEGFSYDARRYFEMLLQTHGPDMPGLFYTYKNEPGTLTSSRTAGSRRGKANAEIDKKGDPLASIIKGQDDLWDVSLLKFIYEITNRSLRTNVAAAWREGHARYEPRRHSRRRPAENRRDVPAGHHGRNQTL